MTWVNGVSYEGMWANGVFHGAGAKRYSRGGGYEGNWVLGFREGTGAHLFAGKFGYVKWTGGFVDDQPHGNGEMEYVGGSIRPFVFENGRPVTNNEGETFDGEVVLDDGSPSTVNVKGRYKGAWCDGKPNGWGVMTWENGVEYKGVWKEGEAHGHGRKLYSEGGGYEGRWVMGKRCGTGINFYDSEKFLGKKYGFLRWEGSFVNNKQHGVGQMYVQAKGMEGDERWAGDTAVKGPVVEFKEGQIVEGWDNNK